MRTRVFRSNADGVRILMEKQNQGQPQTQFTVSHDDQNFGPFTREEIAMRLAAGEFTLVDFVYDEAKSDWVTLLEFMPHPTAKTESPEEVDFGAVTARVQIEDFEMQERTVIESKIEPSVKPEIAAPAEIVSVPDLIAGKSDLASAPATKSKAEKDTARLNKSTKAVESSEAALEVKNGIGHIELMRTEAGQMQLKLKVVSGSSLELPKSIPIVVKAARAEKIAIEQPVDVVAGENFTLNLHAVDRFGNLDERFVGAVSLSLVGATTNTTEMLNFAKGRAAYQANLKVAEAVTAKLEDSGASGLDTKTDCNFFVRAAPAARLEVVAPEEIVAGEPVKLMVRAFDAFGNLATDFGGSVSVEMDNTANVA